MRSGFVNLKAVENWVGGYADTTAFLKDWKLLNRTERAEFMNAASAEPR